MESLMVLEVEVWACARLRMLELAEMLEEAPSLSVLTESMRWFVLRCSSMMDFSIVIISLLFSTDVGLGDVVVLSCRLEGFFAIVLP